jgi:hypothetical protein
VFTSAGVVQRIQFVGSDKLDGKVGKHDDHEFD